jgi:GT2 family glycosyltransferase
MSFISIIIPNYNGVRTIHGCLESISAAKDDGVEIIVVDDCSDDGSRDIIQSHPCRLIALTERSGAATARNTGAAASRGEVLFFIDADCRLTEDTLPVLRRSLDSYPAGTVLGGTYTPRPVDAGFFNQFQSVFINYSETKNSAHPDYIASHAMAVPADVFRRAGGFPGQFLPIIEDVEFSHRLRRNGIRLVMAPDLQVRHQFDFTFGRSLRNAARKTRYWIEYSLANKDLLSDSGTASVEMKINGVVWLLSVLAVLLYLALDWPGILLAAPLLTAVSFTASRRLMAAFHRTGGLVFALAAGVYYTMVYPAAIWIGALQGAWQYAVKRFNAKCKL